MALRSIPSPARPNKRIRAQLAIIAVTLALPAASAQGLEPLFGTWHLNFAESTFVSGAPPYVRVICKIEPWKDGMKVVYDMVGTRGGITHWEWTGKVDGRDYAMQGIEDVVTYAYRRTNTNVYDVVVKVDGRITTNTKITVSPNAGVLTVTSTASNAQGQRVINTAIYNKR